MWKMSGMDSIEGFLVHGYVDYPPTYRHIGSHGPKIQADSVLRFGIWTVLPPSPPPLRCLN